METEIARIKQEIDYRQAIPSVGPSIKAISTMKVSFDVLEYLIKRSEEVGTITKGSILKFIDGRIKYFKDSRTKMDKGEIEMSSHGAACEIGALGSYTVLKELIEKDDPKVSEK